MPSVIEAIGGAMKDPILAEIDFSQKTAEQILSVVAFAGSPVQRAAMVQYLTPASALFFPGIYRLAMANNKSLKTAMDFLKMNMTSLAGHFGVQFSGDPDSVAYTIIRDFGGLSVADFMIFFERCKSGRYRQEYQHVASRGINYDFLKTWLDQYSEEREAARMEIHSQYSQPKNVDSEGSVSPEKIREEMEARRAAAALVRENRRQLQMKGEQIRADWEKEIYITQNIRQWFKLVEVEQLEMTDYGERMVKRRQEVLCDEKDTDAFRYEDYPIRAHRPGGVERLMKRELHEFVTFGDSELTKELFERLQNEIAAKYTGESNLEAYQVAELKALLNAVSQFRRQMNAGKLLNIHIQQLHPDATEDQIRKTVFKTMTDFEGIYFDEYLPNCIGENYPPLKLNEWIWQGVLYNYVKSGNDNPVKNLIFV